MTISSLTSTFSLPIPIGISSSDMAARSGWINWDALGEEAEEDAAGLNYDYEFVVVDPGSHSITHVCSFPSWYYRRSRSSHSLSSVDKCFGLLAEEEEDEVTLQACMREVIQQLGGNRYKVPHMRKEVLQRLGTLPVTLKCTANFVKWAIDSLEDA
jgi:hypothetical protein